jgi:hypothetical protein
LPSCLPACSEGQPVVTDFELLPFCLPACSEGQPVATDFELFLTIHPTDRPMPTPAEGQPVEKLEINFQLFPPPIDRPTYRQPLLPGRRCCATFVTKRFSRKRMVLSLLPAKSPHFGGKVLFE